MIIKRFNRNGKQPSTLKQRGISLLEVLLSLSIIAIILVMATRYFFVASRNDKVNITRQEIGAISSAIEAWKNQNATYMSDSLPLSIGTLSYEGFLNQSKNMIKANSESAELYNPWGEKIEIANVSATGAEIHTILPSVNECNMLRNSYPTANTCSNGKFVLPIGKQPNQS